MVTRLAESMQVMYPSVRLIATCECEEHQRCDFDFSDHPSLPLRIYHVPFDYGLSQGKTFLTNVTATELVLILDDDFVLTPHTCLECMALHLRSQWHEKGLPLDLIGFPVLEDERNFGAYRGTMRVHQQRLLLEPFAKVTKESIISIS